MVRGTNGAGSCAGEEGNPFTDKTASLKIIITKNTKKKHFRRN